MESRYEKSLKEDIKKLQKILGELLKRERENSIYGDITAYTGLVDIDKSTIYAGERGESNFTISRLYTLLRANGKSHEEIVNLFTALVSSSSEATTFNLPAGFEQQVRQQVKNKSGKSEANALQQTHIERMYLILANCNKKKLLKKQIAEIFELASYTKHFEMSFQTALSLDWIAMTNPGKPNANNQRYYTTDAGVNALRLEEK